MTKKIKKKKKSSNYVINEQLPKDPSLFVYLII